MCTLADIFKDTQNRLHDKANDSILEPTRKGEGGKHNIRSQIVVTHWRSFAIKYLATCSNFKIAF